MALPDIRHRVRYLFVAVMVGHILLISSQVNSQRGVSLLQEVLTLAVAETQRAAWGVVGGVRHVWDSYVALRGVRAENDRLVRETADLRVQLQQERALARGAGELRELLGLRQQLAWSTVAAEVIGGSTSPDFRAITIDKGRDAGVRDDMAVIAPAGVVGRTVDPAPRASSVQLLTDQNAAAAAMVARSGSQGIVVGADNGTLRFEYLAAVADVHEGDEVVTAGIDGVYPKGIRIGRVVRVERSGPSIRRVIVAPAVDFSSLALVLVVTAPHTPVAGPGGP